MLALAAHRWASALTSLAWPVAAPLALPLAGLMPAASVNLAQRRLTISLAAPLAALPRRRCRKTSTCQAWATLPATCKRVDLATHAANLPRQNCSGS